MRSERSSSRSLSSGAITEVLCLMHVIRYFSSPCRHWFKNCAAHRQSLYEWLAAKQTRDGR